GLIAKARGECHLAADALRRYLPRDPKDATLCYHLAAALFAAGADKEGKEWAGEALRLDQVAPRSRPLTDPQREQARRCVRAPRAGWPVGGAGGVGRIWGRCPSAPRSQAERGTASRDAPRPVAVNASDGTRSVPSGVPTRSVGTRAEVARSVGTR